MLDGGDQGRIRTSNNTDPGLGTGERCIGKEGGRERGDIAAVDTSC